MAPAAPRPEMARPMISASAVRAVPAMIEPSSNKDRAVKKTHLTGKKVYILPYNSWHAHDVKRLLQNQPLPSPHIKTGFTDYAEPIQPTWLGECRSSVIFGIAVARIFASCILMQ